MVFHQAVIFSRLQKTYLIRCKETDSEKCLFQQCLKQNVCFRLVSVDGVGYKINIFDGNDYFEFGQTEPDHYFKN